MRLIQLRGKNSVKMMVLLVMLLQASTSSNGSVATQDWTISPEVGVGSSLTMEYYNVGGYEKFTDYSITDDTGETAQLTIEAGMRFTNVFSQPLCTPSRVKIMTGKYNYRNYEHFGYLNETMILIET